MLFYFKNSYLESESRLLVRGLPIADEYNLIRVKGGNMAHLSKKKKELKAENNKLRAFNSFNTGTRNMGFKSNNERKAASHMMAAGKI